MINLRPSTRHSRGLRFAAFVPRADKKEVAVIKTAPTKRLVQSLLLELGGWAPALLCFEFRDGVPVVHGCCFDVSFNAKLKGRPKQEAPSGALRAAACRKATLVT